eukprot:804440-Prymnesium_polylepis.2
MDRRAGELASWRGRGRGEGEAWAWAWARRGRGDREEKAMFSLVAAAAKGAGPPGEMRLQNDLTKLQKG